MLEYLLANLSENLSLEIVANYFNFRIKTFSRLFSKEVRMTFYQYLKNARILRSIELIIEGKLSINQIAFVVGYKSIAAYSYAFQHLTNKRPTDYKV